MGDVSNRVRRSAMREVLLRWAETKGSGTNRRAQRCEAAGNKLIYRSESRARECAEEMYQSFPRQLMQAPYQCRRVVDGVHWHLTQKQFWRHQAS